MDSIVENTLENEEDTASSEQQTNVGVTDEKLNELIESMETNIRVIGCGGAGNNTVNRMFEEGIDGADLVAVNTDARDLINTNADSKLLIGEKICNGRGAGSVPRQGEQSAEENREEIEDLVRDQDMVFITAGMGGGTGTGAAPVVAEVASQHALTVSVVTTPFHSEGQTRMDNAKGGLERLRQHSDTVIVVPNERLLDHVPEVPLEQAFRVADEVLMRSVKGITELIKTPSLVNLDFADVRTIMGEGGVAMIGLGESSSSSRSTYEDSVLEALRSPLLDVNISGATNVLVNVTGGPNMKMEEAEGVVKTVEEKIDGSARIIWGAGTNEDLQSTIRTMVIVTGVDSPQIYGPNEETTTEDSTTESDSSIDFIA